MTKMSLFFIFFFCSNFLFSFSTEKIQDTANNGEYYKTKGNFIPSKNLAMEGIREVEVNLVKYLRQNRDPFYFLIVEFRGNSWFLLEEKKSLTLIIDGREYSYNLYQKPQRAELPKFVTETGWFKIQDGIPIMLAEAKEIKIKINGKAASLEETLNKGNHEVFKYFHDTYILNEQQRREAKQKN